MNEAYFQNFMTGGLFVLVGVAASMAWCMWRIVDRQRDMEALGLEGVGHELRANLYRMLREISDVARGNLKSASDLLPLSHPQLDAVLAGPLEKDRQSLTVIRATYGELVHRKADLRTALTNGSDTSAEVDAAVNSVIDGIAQLYLWTEHDGKMPEAAPSTRSWWVRDWMKAGPFAADMFPGLHLRDQVVERLRQSGMVLTPKPLTHTAHEFFSMQYDRKADPNAPFWKRKLKQPEEAVAAVAASAAVADAVEDMAAPEPEIAEAEAPMAELAPDLPEPEEAEAAMPVEDPPEQEPAASELPETADPAPAPESEEMDIALAVTQELEQEMALESPDPETSDQPDPAPPPKETVF